MTARGDRILFTCLILDLLLRRYAFDDISTRVGDHNGPMIEGQQYKLQCDVHIVHSVVVRWYKGQTLVNQTTFNDTSKTPVNKTVTLMIRPDRSDDGVQYRCEAELDLGEEGPQPPHKLLLDRLNITVHYEPTINETKLPSIVSVFRGHSVVIVCEAEGNPKPKISWNLGTNNTVYNETLTITDSTPEELSCIANNSVGTDIRHVKVSVQENNILIILGIIVAVVVVISVILISICIYYKKKTGRASII